jgi:hypothetical protein
MNSENTELLMGVYQLMKTATMNDRIVKVNVQFDKFPNWYSVEFKSVRSRDYQKHGEVALVSQLFREKRSLGLVDIGGMVFRIYEGNNPDEIFEKIERMKANNKEHGFV